MSLTSISYCPLNSRTYPGQFGLILDPHIARLFANTVAELWSLKLTHHCPWQHLCFPICMFFCVICQKMALVTFSPQHVAFESKLVTPRGQHWGQPRTSSCYYHHHIIMLKLSSSSHHHVKIIITIMIIIMSSRQKASRATISNSMFVMFASIYPNHKEISWNATD